MQPAKRLTKTQLQLVNGFRADVLFELGACLERGTLSRTTYAQAVRLAAGYLTSDEFVLALPSVRSTTVQILRLLPPSAPRNGCGASEVLLDEYESRTLHRGRMRTPAEIAELEHLRQLALDAIKGS